MGNTRTICCTGAAGRAGSEINAVRRGTVKFVVLTLQVLSLTILSIGTAEAAQERSLYLLENPDLAVVVDAANGATIASLIQKSTRQDFTFADPTGGHLAEFRVGDEWPNPAAGPYSLVADRPRHERHELTLRRTAPGWTFTKTFLLPASGTELTVQLAATNTGDDSREIVPLVLDRPALGSAGLDDRANLFIAEANQPGRAVSLTENFWIVPARRWFGVAGDAPGNVLWLTTADTRLNAILPQGDWKTSYPWRPVNPILGWCYVPVRLEPGQSWETQYIYGCARGLPGLTSASPDFAVHPVQQHFTQRPQSVTLQLASTRSGTFSLESRLVKAGEEIRCREREVTLEAGGATEVRLPLPEVPEGPVVLELSLSGDGIEKQTLEVPLCVGAEPAWLLPDRDRDVQTSGMRVTGSALQPEATYHVRTRSPNDLRTTATALSSGGLSAWWCDSLVKIHPQDEANAELPHQPGLTLTAAQGETESAQLVFRNAGDRPASANLILSDLTRANGPGTIPADQLRLFLQHYVDCTTVSDVVRGALGPWPDPLTPMEGACSLPPKQTTGLWLDVSVPRDVPAGDYHGRLRVTLVDGSTHELPLQVRVAAVTLPVASFLRGDMGSGHPAANRIMLAHRQQPRGVGVQPIRTDEGWDFTAYDAEIDELLRLGMNSFQLTSERVEESDRPLIEHLKARNLLERAVHYTRDEPGERRDLAWRRRHYEAPHEIDPDVRVMATVHPYEFAEGVIDIWVPVSNNFNPAMARRMQARGDEVWWYVCCGPKWPFANYFIDYPALDHRAYYWQTYALGIQGVLFWAAHYYHRGQDPWQNPIGLVPNANGDGYLLYPRDEGFVPSLRLKILRDGVEDFDLLKLLEQRVADMTARTPQDPRLAEARSLLRLDDLTPGPRYYRRDPQPYLQWRAEVLAMLERLGLP